MEKNRYSEYDFAKGWGSVSTICGLPDKPFLPPWYAKLSWLEAIDLIKRCPREVHTLLAQMAERGPSRPYVVVKESQVIGKLIDYEIGSYFEDVKLEKVDHILIEQDGEAKDLYYQSIQNFHKFIEIFNPSSVLAQEVVYSKQNRYIGTFDRIVRIDGKLVLIDWKATNFVGYEYKMQVEAYYRALTEMIASGILKITGEWHSHPIWIVQFPKKTEFTIEKNVYQLQSSDRRFKNFLSLLDYYYGKKEDEAEQKASKAETKKGRKKKNETA